ncbi:MAG TPA: DUF2231 domain-containing protein [Gemmatimonadales bacterium]|nr:DUF2231 domain-containing protein [Gemmatimonadales bacterium]
MFGYDWPRLHAALNDLPAALLLVAVVFDLLGAATRRLVFRQVGYWILIVGAIGGAAAVISGLQAEEHIDHGDAVHRVMETHEQLALVTLGIFTVLAVWRILRENRMGPTERALVLAVSLAGLGFLLSASVYGGRLVFDHAAGIPTGVLQDEVRSRGAGHTHAPGEEHGDGGMDGDHDHPAAGPAPAGDSAAAAPADSAAKPGGHTHAPGTPPHEH